MRTWTYAELSAEVALAAYGRACISNDLRRMVLSRAEDQVKNAIAVDIPHGDVDGAFKAGERDDRSDEPVAVAVIQTDLGRPPGGAWNGHRIYGDGGYDVDQRHQPVVFMAEVVMIPIVAALLNAIFDATGHRFQSVPVTQAMLKEALT